MNTKKSTLIKKVVFLIICVLSIKNIKSQNLDKIYGEYVNSMDSFILGDFVTCNSNNNLLVGACAIRQGNTVITRFLDFDGAGNIINAKNIIPTGDYHQLFTLDCTLNYPCNCVE